MTAIAKPENRYLFEKSALLKILKDSRATAKEKLEATKFLYLLKMQTPEEYERFATIFGRFSTPQEIAKEIEPASEPPQAPAKPELPEHLK